MAFGTTVALGTGLGPPSPRPQVVQETAFPLFLPSLTPNHDNEVGCFLSLLLFFYFNPLEELLFISYGAKLFLDFISVPSSVTRF